MSSAAKMSLTPFVLLRPSSSRTPHSLTSLANYRPFWPLATALQAIWTNSVLSPSCGEMTAANDQAAQVDQRTRLTLASNGLVIQTGSLLCAPKMVPGRSADESTSRSRPSP